jgi:hypothetical protein
MKNHEITFQVQGLTETRCGAFKLWIRWILLVQPHLGERRLHAPQLALDGAGHRAGLRRVHPRRSGTSCIAFQTQIFGNQEITLWSCCLPAHTSLHWLCSSVWLASSVADLRTPYGLKG